MLQLPKRNLILLAMLPFLLPVSAAAGSFTLSPIRIDFSPDYRDTAIAIQNEAPTPVSVQARVYAWHVENGEDRYLPTKQILIAPPIMTIAPNTPQVVRAAFRFPADEHKEMAYRIFFAELPQVREGNKLQVDMILTIGIPVFMAPRVPSEPEPPTWSAQIRGLSDGKPILHLSVENRGNMHFRIDRMQARELVQHGAATDRNTGPLLSSQEMGSYVLAGTERHWDVSLSPGIAKRLGAVELGYANDGKESVVTVPVSRP